MSASVVVDCLAIVAFSVLAWRGVLGGEYCATLITMVVAARYRPPIGTTGGVATLASLPSLLKRSAPPPEPPQAP
jgi:hypothetical protein